jgi:hypothetical protein
MSYTKLFSHIVTSSIWSEDDQTRILWITMLALADKHGEVMASVPGLAKVAGLSIDATKAGLEKFLSPDPYSRTPDEEGRRLEVIDGGWAIINYAKHRRMASLDEQREKAAVRQRRFRERKQTNSNEQSRIVTDESRTSNEQVTLETDNAEAEAEAEAENTPKPPKGGRRKSVEKVMVTDPLALRVAALFGRRESTPWLMDEWDKFKALSPSPEEVTDMEAHYASGGKFLRRDLKTLLNNWMGELDRFASNGKSVPYSPNL